MPRRKKAEVQGTSDPSAAAAEVHAADPALTDQVATALDTQPEEPPASFLPMSEAPAAERNGNGHPEGDGATTDGKRPFKRNFDNITGTHHGIWEGEDRRFNQVYIQFANDRPPTAAEKAKLQEAGFRYRAGEKRWDAPASAATRVRAQELVSEFRGIGLGTAPSR